MPRRARMPCAAAAAFAAAYASASASSSASAAGVAAAVLGLMALAAFGVPAEAQGAPPTPPGVEAFFVERVSEQSVRLIAHVCSDGPGHADVTLEKQEGERWELVPEEHTNTSNYLNYLVSDLFSDKNYKFRLSVQLPQVATTPLPYTSSSTSTESSINVTTEDIVTETPFVTTVEYDESTMSLPEEDNLTAVEGDNNDEQSNCSALFPAERELEIKTCKGRPPPASDVIGRSDSVCWSVPSHDCVLGQLVFHVVLRIQSKNRQNETQYKKFIHRNCSDHQECCLELPEDITSKEECHVSAFVTVAWEDSKDDFSLSNVDWVRVSSGPPQRSVGGLAWLLPLCVLLIGLPLNYYLMRLRWKRRNKQPLRGEPWRPPQVPPPLSSLPHHPPSPPSPASPSATSPLFRWELDNEGYLVSAAVPEFTEDAPQPNWRASLSDSPPPIPPLPNRSAHTSRLPPDAGRLPSSPPPPPPRNAAMTPPTPPPRPSRTLTEAPSS